MEKKKKLKQTNTMTSRVSIIETIELANTNESNTLLENLEKLTLILRSLNSSKTEDKETSILDLLMDYKESNENILLGNRIDELKKLSEIINPIDSSINILSKNVGKILQAASEKNNKDRSINFDSKDYSIFNEENSDKQEAKINLAPNDAVPKTPLRFKSKTFKDDEISNGINNNGAYLRLKESNKSNKSSKSNEEAKNSCTEVTLGPLLQTPKNIKKPKLKIKNKENDFPKSQAINIVELSESEDNSINNKTVSFKEKRPKLNTNENSITLFDSFKCTNKDSPKSTVFDELNDLNLLSKIKINKIAKRKTIGRFVCNNQSSAEEIRRVTCNLLENIRQKCHISVNALRESYYSIYDLLVHSRHLGHFSYLVDSKYVSFYMGDLNKSLVEMAKKFPYSSCVNFKRSYALFVENDNKDSSKFYVEKLRKMGQLLFYNVEKYRIVYCGVLNSTFHKSAKNFVFNNLNFVEIRLYSNPGFLNDYYDAETSIVVKFDEKLSLELKRYSRLIEKICVKELVA